MRHSNHARLAALLFLSLGASRCGGTAVTTAAPTGDAGSDVGSPPNLPPPTQHRPSAVACPSGRPPGLNTDAGTSGGIDCTNDSQCTAGTNGRCTPSGHNGPPSCTYDTCVTDADCSQGKLCECGAAIGTGRFPNACLPGDCRIDSDCGAGNFCSPTFDTTCGAYNGVVGYYCHTPADTCTNDDQCREAGPGYCAWQAPLGKWACNYSFCAG